jgi:hypothetical protein
MNYLDKLKHLHQRSATGSTIRVGDWIEWERADLTAQHGVVDFLQTYPNEVWAFCTLPGGKWTAVNTKYILKKEHGYDGNGPVIRGGQR